MKLSSQETVTGVQTISINWQHLLKLQICPYTKRDVQVVDEERNRRFGVSGYMRKLQLMIP
jgi:hypothetical protein